MSEANSTHAVVWPPETLSGTASRAKLGMWVFLITDALSFAGLLIAYAALRAASPLWRCSEEAAARGLCATPEPVLGINFTAVLTSILITSSLTMVLAQSAAQEKKTGLFRAFLALTILGGLSFLLGQYQEYFGLWAPGLLDEGLSLSSSLYGSTFFLITGFHGLHVLSGVLYLSAVLVGSFFRPLNTERIEAAGLFWHFVDLVWILVFTFVYLIPE
jgi:heme/copper-type cytochrome/quinol oxidase subunit 3